MVAPAVDVFLLYNEREKVVDEIHQALEDHGISTFYWRKDIPIGETWDEVEGQHLADAHAVLVLLGDAGWEPQQVELTRKANALGKFIMPILVGNPPDEALSEIDGLFKRKRYLDLRVLNEKSIQQLVDAIRQNQNQPSDSPQSDSLVDNWIAQLVDGSEDDRLAVIEEIKQNTSVNRVSMGERLRMEIQTHYSPLNEESMSKAPRNPKMVPIIRGWMLSALIWTDAEEPSNRSLILQHVQIAHEPDENARFWVLVGLNRRRPSYLEEALDFVMQTTGDAPYVLALAMRHGTKAVGQFTEQLFGGFDGAWQVLRVLRYVPMAEMIGPACDLLMRAEDGNPIVYDIIYALSVPPIVVQAAQALTDKLGIARTAELVLSVFGGVAAYVARLFAGLLAVMDPEQVLATLDAQRSNPKTRVVAIRLRETLAILKAEAEQVVDDDDESRNVSGFNPDTDDISKVTDYLDITQDVKTLTAVMIAKEMNPPMAIGLFGAWGSGKSFFMNSIKQEVEHLSARAKTEETSFFCQNVVQIKFNAWHYLDTSLWATLVSNILEGLANHVSPKASYEDKKKQILETIEAKQKVIEATEAEKAQVEKQLLEAKTKADELQVARESKEVTLADFTTEDIVGLWSAKDTNDLETALKDLGIPAAMHNVADLRSVIAESFSTKGQLSALYYSIFHSEDKKILGQLAIAVVVIPFIALGVFLFHRNDGWLTGVIALIAEFSATVGGLSLAVRKGLNRVKLGMDQVQAFNKRLVEALAAKRAEKSAEETKLLEKIEAWKNEIQAFEQRSNEAALAQKVANDELIALETAMSLKQFLLERTTSDDYRKHLGLISTIRRDFESLAEKLAHAKNNLLDKYKPVDRIILYIDDLDRCPADKVLEVLQAVHLLLAYPLFVVVVGVDPRWLLHSLSTTMSAFQNKGKTADGDTELWSTTPQNFLEKIFQIPFSLRPMTESGYGRLMDGLLLPKGNEVHEKAKALTTTDMEPKKQADPVVDPSQNPKESDLNRPKDPGEKPVIEQMVVTPTPETEQVSDQKPFIVNEASLVIQPWESKFAKELFPLMVSPRGAKRFTNIYRLLKASVGRNRLAAFEGKENKWGEFQVPMLLLAILVGEPDEAARRFPGLMREAIACKKSKQDLDLKANLQQEASDFTRAIAEIDPIMKSTFPTDAALYIEWLPKVARFSFELGQSLREVE